MTKRSVFTICALWLLSLATVASAHDPALHDANDAPRAKPTTCEEYADRNHFSNDLTDPDIKALKDRCDQAKAEADKRSAKPE